MLVRASSAPGVISRQPRVDFVGVRINPERDVVRAGSE